MGHIYGMMAQIGKGDLKVGKRKERPMFRLKAHKREGGGRGAPAKVHWPLMGLVLVYLCSLGNKYTRMNPEKLRKVKWDAIKG